VIREPGIVFQQKIIVVSQKYWNLEVHEFLRLWRAFAGSDFEACKLISIFCSELSRTLLGGEYKLLVSFTKVNAINLFQTPHVLCITDDRFCFVQNIDD
jgi:hypothetical protein